MIRFVAAAASALCFIGVQGVGGESDYTCTVPVAPKSTPHVIKVVSHPHSSPLSCKCGGTTINVQIHNNVHINTHVNTHTVIQNHNNIHPNIHNKGKKK